MTKADLIKWLQEDELPGNTPVFIPNDPEGRECTQIEDAGHEQIGTLENPQKIIVLYSGW